MGKTLPSVRHCLKAPLLTAEPGVLRAGGAVVDYNSGMALGHLGGSNDRGRANLALARHRLRDIEENLEV